MKIAKTKPTIWDVARVAAVSKTTASDALSGRPSVHPETRARVLAVAKDLGYFPSFAAQSLRGGRPPLIGIFSYATTSWSATEMTFLMADMLLHQGLRSILFPFQGVLSQDEVFERALAENLLGGAIVIGSEIVSDKTLIKALDTGLPLVTVDLPVTGASNLMVDDESGGRLAAQCLASRTKNTILIMGRYQNPTAPRIQGFRKQWRKNASSNLPTKQIVESTSLECGYKLGSKLKIKKGSLPGIFSTWGDMVALGLLRAFADRGLTAGRDYLLIGYDGLKATNFSIPRITTIAQPFNKIAFLAAKWITEDYKHGNKTTRCEKLAPEFIKGDTA